MSEQAKRETAVAPRGSNRRRRSRGQSLVEFVIVVPVVLIILLGALDFGRAFLGWVVLNNASRVGANFAALHPGAWGPSPIAYQRTEYEDLVRDARNDAAIAFAGCDDATLAVPDPTFPDGKGLGDHAVVRLDCTFDPITPLIGEVLTGFGAGTITVSAQSVFAIREDRVAVSAPTPPPSCLSKIGDVEIDGMDAQFHDATVGSPSSWFWVVEGPYASYVSQNPFHTYTTPGTYTVTLDAVVGGLDCTQDQRVVSVSPTEPPDPDASEPPSASPEPSSSPSPCTVPGLVGKQAHTAQGFWEKAGFTTQVEYVADAAADGKWKVEYQSLTSGNDVACNVTIELGPDPQAPAGP